MTAPAKDGIDITEFLIREKNEVTEEKRKREERKKNKASMKEGV